MDREVSEGSIIGGAIGVMVWLFDFRHLAIGGPPDTIISNAIRNFLSIGGKPLLDSFCSFGSSGINMVCVNLATLFILVVAGIISGRLVVGMFRMARGRR